MRSTMHCRGFGHCLLPILALILASCGSEAEAQSNQRPLLASELVYEDEAEERNISLQLDPWLAEYPQIARLISQAKIKALSAEDCSDTMACDVSSEIDLHNRGHRLISVIDTTYSYFGGAHPLMTATDATFDTKTKERLRFGDLFNSWEAARVLLQAEWCEAVSQRTICPPIENQSLAISGSNIFVKTSDYAFSSYAEGPAEAYLSITPTLVALVKPEYQSSFDLSEESFGY